MLPALVETEMILPNLRFTMCGAAAFDMYQTPLRLVSMMVCSASSGVS